MMQEQAFSRLLAEIYDAALDPAGWAGISAVVGRSFEAGSCAIQARSDELGTTEIVSATANLTPEAIFTYSQHFHKSDDWYAGALSKPLGLVWQDYELADPRRFENGEFYSDWCRKYGQFYIMGSVFPLDVVGGLRPLSGLKEFGAIGIHRDRDEASFTPEAKRTLQLVLPHLQRALQMRSRLGQLTRERNSALAALEGLSLGVLLLGPGCEILFANTVAEGVIRVGDAITAHHRRLWTCDPGKLKGLETMVRGAARTSVSAGFQAGGVLSLPRPNGRALSLLICPMPTRGLSGPIRPMALAFLGCGNPTAGTSPGTVLARIYGLTAAETRLVDAILAGDRLTEYAETANISINTAKTLMKRVFAKTGHSRQTELIREAFGDPVVRLASQP